jgi:hypothetical protein
VSLGRAYRLITGFEVAKSAEAEREWIIKNFARTDLVKNAEEWLHGGELFVSGRCW